MQKIQSKYYVINIFFLSLRNLFDPKVFKWVLYTTIVTLITLAAITFAIVYYIKDFLDTGIPFLGDFLIYGATLGALWGSTILFVPISTIVFALFQDKIMDQIEKKYYPEVSQEAKIKIATMFFAGIKLLGWSLLINIIIFPAAIIWGSSLFWIPVNILITGYLISKEYTEAIGLRKMTFAQTKEVRNNLFWPCWFFGTIGALLFFIPLINLFAAPFITILMLHTLNIKGFNGPIAD
ncbi:EI24 domain-containing protein [Alphaproteobacteria bacterium]|mgnify:CR=1 FL=1|nr:EI24 domain-containing protein [Alphaproteobacteria bacterium]